MKKINKKNIRESDPQKEREITLEKHEDSDITELQERYPDIYKAYTQISIDQFNLFAYQLRLNFKKNAERI